MSKINTHEYLWRTGPIVRPFTTDLSLCRNESLTWGVIYSSDCARQMWLQNDRIRTLNAIARRTLWALAIYIVYNIT